MNDEDVQRIIDDAVASFPHSVQEAVGHALGQIRSLPNFESLVSQMVKGEVETLVYAARHKVNVRIRKESGGYGGRSKVRVGDSAGVRQAFMSSYLYFIGGKTLGQMTCDDLVEAAVGERLKAEGHLLNVRILEAVMPLVNKGQKVQDALSENRLRAIIAKVQEQVENGEAA